MDYWQIKNPELFESFKKEINDKYPNLIIIDEDNLVYIKGTLRIRDNSGVILDSFVIDIKVPFNFPQEIPEVKEVKNKIPHSKDRHFDNDGKACLCYRDAIPMHWSIDPTISGFMKNFVEPFFLWQIEHDVTDGKNQNKAYKHGTQGGIQFYGELLNTTNVKVIHKFVEYLSKSIIKDYWFCYCDNGKLMRDCHINEIMEYASKIKTEDARKTFKELNQFTRIIVS